MLHFININPLAEKCTSLVIRKCNKDIWRKLNKAKTIYNRNFLLIGSPGIGKSMFLFFLMWKVKIEGKSLVDVNGEHEENYLFHNYKVFITDKSHYFKAFKCNDVWFLVKSKKPPRACKGKTLLIASIDEKSFEKVCDLGGFYRYYMPPWTFEESLLKNEYSDADKFTCAEFRERFELAGAVQRHTFVNYEEYCEGLEEAINRLE